MRRTLKTEKGAAMLRPYKGKMPGSPSQGEELPFWRTAIPATSEERFLTSFEMTTWEGGRQGCRRYAEGRMSNGKGKLLAEISSKTGPPRIKIERSHSGQVCI